MSDTDYGAIYRDVRLRITAVVQGVPADALDDVVPATPRWRGRDVLAHLAGAAADIVAGNLDDVASERWTQAQVDARLDVPVAAMLEEWERAAEIVEPMVPQLPGLARVMLLTDAMTHEHDLRGALGVPGARDSEAVAFAFSRAVHEIGRRRGDGEAVRIEHDAGTTVAGNEPATATLRTSRFEIVRAAVGRRSYDQIRAWDWDGDPRPETVVYEMFSPPRPTPLDE